MRIVDKTFFTQDAEALAKSLIGKLLCRNINGQIIKHEIIETECYIGETDTACHAHKGKTNRTKTMWELGGTCYVYLIYGIHNMLNIISGNYGNAQGVLIRGVKGYIGPGKLTKALAINLDLNMEDITTSNKIWVEDIGISAKLIAAKRVGIDYATQEDQNKLFRFIKEGN